MKEDLLKRDLAIPLNNQIQLLIANRIKSGEYPLGSKLPNELELSDEFQVSRPTIRKALDGLEEVGMIKRLRPKGTFVSQTMDKSWFESDNSGKLGAGFHLPERKVQVALEEGLTDSYLLHCFEDFMATTGTQVELVHWNSWYAAIENIINKFVEKQVPDVFSVSNDSVGIFARMGVIQPLDQFMMPEQRERIKHRCVQYGLGSYVYNGQLYGYPLFSETRLLVYRKDHFQNAGIPDPLEYPLTHESFLEVGKKLSNPEQGLYAFAFPISHEPQTLQETMPWIIQRGGRLLRIDNGRVVPATEEPAFIEALQWYTDLSLKHKICPPIPPARSSRDISLLLMRGMISMMIATPGVFKWLLAATPDGSMKYGLAPFPRGPENNFSFMGGMPLCISSNCKNPDFAWELISYLTRPNILKPYLARTGSLLPIECYDRSDITAAVERELYPVVDALETAVPHTYPVGYNQCLDFIRTGYWQIPMPQVLELILKGELSVENAAKFLSMSIRSFSKQNEY